MAEYLTNTTDLTAVADAIRSKGGTSAQLVYPNGFVAAIQAISAGGSKEEQEKSLAITANGSYTIEPDDGKTLSKVTATVNVPDSGGGTTPIAPDDITFYDYDGTVVAAWSAEELSSKTELPAYPSHDGLVCQGWNWTLEELKSENRKTNVGALYTTDDNSTRIYIHLPEGRTSPRLGICPNGTVTVDWGDGTEADILTGTSVTSVKWTPVHEYAKSGDYVIKLMHTGSVGFSGSSTANQYSYILRASSGTDVRNMFYLDCITKIEFGTCDNIGLYTRAFMHCTGIKSISVSNSVTINGGVTFQNCQSLSFFTIPRDTYTVQNDMFRACPTIEHISVPRSATMLAANAFYNCTLLRDLCVPSGVTVFGANLFYANTSLVHIFIPSGVSNINNNTFMNCGGMVAYDFSEHTSIPTLANTNAFSGIASDCEIRVPSALVDTWKAATNWSTYASHIVGV